MRQIPLGRIAVLGAIGCLVLTSAAQAEVLTPDSRVAAVTVYPGAAHVTRQAKVTLTAGTHSVVFPDIIPVFDDNSLTVGGSSTAGVKIFGAYVKTEQLKETADARAKDLEQRMEDLDDQITEENNILQGLQREQQYLDSVNLFSAQQIPRDLVTAMPGADRLKETQTYLQTSLADLNDRREKANKNLRALNREKNLLARELADLRGTARMARRSIVVDLECAKPGGLTVEVSYLVGGANWNPVYDARTKVAENKLELSAYGVIRQSSGEDWVDADLTLSTAQPTLSGRMPYIAPWVLQAYQPRRQRGMMQKAMAPAMQMEAFSTDSLGGMADSLREEEPVPAEFAAAAVAQTGIAVTYHITRPVTVKSDGAETKYPISSQVLAADFAYSTFPRAQGYAYLGSRVKNAEDLQLLGGPVNLFLEGDYVGKSSLDNTGPGQEFDLYLGVDENVKVERKEISRKVDDVLIAGIASSTIKVTTKYRLTVENYKPRDIKVKLFEAMPVSANDRIKSKVFDVSVPPTAKDWQNRQGIWLWELSLKPSEKQEIFYSFTVEYPKDMPVGGL